MKFKISKIVDIVDKENIKKVFLFFKNLPWLIGENIFSFFIVMISAAIILGVFFFARNVVQIANRISINPSQLPVLDEKTLEGILDSWQFRQDKFDGADNKIYPNLFSPKGN